MDAESDEQLLRRARQGDQAAFEALAVRYRRRIYTAAYRLALDEDDALDIAQETILTFCRRIDRIRDAEALWPWLRRVALNLSLSLIRRRAAERDRMRAYGREAIIVEARQPFPGEALERRQTAERIELALRRLPPRQRAVFVMRFFEERPLAEIAETLRLSVGTVKSHLFRATRQMRGALRAESASGREAMG